MGAEAGLAPAAGDVLLDGVELLRLSLAGRAIRVAFMPQTPRGGVALSVLEGVLTAPKAGPWGDGAPNAMLRRRAFAAVERFGSSASRWSRSTGSLAATGRLLIRTRENMPSRSGGADLAQTS